MCKIIYQKTYPRMDLEELLKEANDIEPEDFGQDKTLSYEDIREKLSEGVTYVLLPERRKSAVDFVQESIRISEEMRISLTIKQFKSHFSAFFTFPYGGNYGCFKDAIKYADEIHFFTNKSNDEITMVIDHYTHAVYRHGIQFHP